MKKIIYSLAAFFIISLGFFAYPSISHAAPPAYFQTSPIVTNGLDGPSGFEFAPDGRIFILQRTGEVKIYKNGQLLPNNFITLPSIASGDRGLIGIAFDPDYATNKYVYFYYTALDQLNYLVRFSAATDIASDGPVIIYHTTSLSEQLHVGGGIAFGNDGKLYFTVGDNGYPPNAQSLDNPHGKILRINKDGTIPSDNPFVNTPGALPEIWAYGLRNPWRLQFDHQTGFLYDGDVGNNTWEEVNHIEKGKNYGWPVCEGVCNTSGMTNAIYTYWHENQSSAVTGGPVYRSSMFPSNYVGRYFFSDYARGFIKTLGLNAAGNMTDVQTFDDAAGSVVDMRVAPDGSLYYITYYPGRLYRITYSTTNQVPTAAASADNLKGLSPFTVHFSSAGSSDPDNNPLSYFWDFGDGQISTSANPTHTYNSNGSYLAQLTVSDGSNTVGAIPLVIQVGLAPTVTIGTPTNNSTYKAGDSITYSVSAIDGVGNDMNDAKIGVEILFHHLTHIHPFLGPLYGRNGTFTIPTTGEPSDATWFEIKATAVDTNGLATTKSTFIYPRKSDLTFQTNPPGLQLAIDGEPFTSPQTITHVVGFQREIQAPSPQYLGNDLYEFVSWSDAGTQTHNINTPSNNTTYIANYVKTGSVTPFVANYYSNMNLSGNPVLTRNDNFVNFDWGLNSPSANVPADNFSVRWSKTENFNSGNYEFVVTADDGVRLFVDNNLIIDKWIDQSAATYKSTIPLTNGPHSVRMEYYDNGYDALAKLSWTQTSSSGPTPTPTPTPIVGNGFTAQYFNNMSLSGNSVLSRNDDQINFDWGLNSPGPGVNVDNFSARWIKTQNFAEGDYQFTVTADDGVRLYLDNNLVIDQWIDQAATSYTITQHLTAGNHTIKMEYYENGYDAFAKLDWSSVSSPTPTPTQIPGNDFTGQYFNNLNLSGSPILTRSDASVNFDWANSSPASNIPADNFSVRWTKTQNFAAGDYMFTVTADDGVRLKIDGQTVLDKWIDQSAATYTVTQNISSGNHTIIMEYYEKGGDAVAKLSWAAVVVLPPTPTPTPVPNTNGFSGQYFNNMNLSGNPVLTRTDQTVNFDWIKSSPAGNINVDNFSARWTKTENFSSGDYKFTVTADDGVRLKLDGQTILDQWIDQAASTYSVTKTLSAGNHTVVMEYYENSGDAVAKLSWSQISSPVPTPTPLPGNDFSAQYFNNINLSGSPALTRNDNQINFDWGLGRPDAVINVDNFSARWTKTQNFAAGDYKFTVTADDGVRLKLDGQTIIDKWIDQSATTYTVTKNISSGSHTLVIEYFENGEDAIIQFSFAPISVIVPTPTPTPLIVQTPTPTPIQTSNFFSGQYYANMDLTGSPALERSDAQINFDWGESAPDVSLPIDHFSARWSKTENLVGGNYRFNVSADDGIRIKIDGVVVYDQWIDQAASPTTFDTSISAGNHQLVVEYYDQDLMASCQVNWIKL